MEGGKGGLKNWMASVLQHMLTGHLDARACTGQAHGRFLLTGQTAAVPADQRCLRAFSTSVLWLRTNFLDPGYGSTPSSDPIMVLSKGGITASDSSP